MMIVISLALIQMFGPPDKLTIPFRFVSRFYSGYYKLAFLKVARILYIRRTIRMETPLTQQGRM